MTRYFLAAFFGVAALTLSAVSIGAKEAPASATTKTSAPVKPGTEPLDVGETTEQAAQNGDSVAAIVNDTVISDYDLRQRVALFVATSGVRPSADAMKQIRSQVLKQLETERLQLLEAQKNNVSVSAADVDKSIDNILKDNHLTKEQLNAMMSRNGVHISTLRAQIAAQIAWSKAVQGQYGDRVNVSAADVDDEMQRLAEGKNKPHFYVAEIFQAVDNPEDDARVRKSMDDLEVQMKSGAPFATVARQFSQNPTAAAGGDLGVVIEGQLPKELNDALIKMRPGVVTDPIKSVGGYYILYLRGRQEGADAKIPDAGEKVNAHPDTLPLARVLLPLPPKATKDVVMKVAQMAAAIRTHIETCDGLPEFIHQIKGVVYMNLGNMRVADLSPEIQHALAQTESGETTLPFESAAGVELIVRCDKAQPKLTAFHVPSRDEIEQQIFEERIGVLSREYMRDLRRNADIELPGEGFGAHKNTNAENQ